MEIFRQGDVLLIKVSDKTTVAGDPVEREAGRVVLAHGEATGHTHAIADDTAVLTRDADVLADLHRELVAKKIFQADWRVDALLSVGDGGSSLRHEEHGAIGLSPGKYAVIRQREYAPEQIRQVAD